MTKRWRVWRFPILLSLILNFVLVTLVGQLGLDNPQVLHPSNPGRTAAAIPPSGHMSAEGRRARMAREQKLTDLVMPFHQGQIPRVASNLKTWIEYLPCTPPAVPWKPLMDPIMNEQEFYASQENLGSNVMLTFALSGAYNATVDQAVREEFNRLPASVKQCFRGAQVYFANFQGKDDEYLKATRSLFENLLEKKMPLENPYYALYMEPDMLPVRKYWLTALDATMRYPASPFWVRGSLFRGEIPSVFGSAFNALHINGNAIYNLRDPAFWEYYRTQVHETTDAYDVDIVKPLIDPDRFNMSGPLVAKYRYTNLIWNLWHTAFSVNDALALNPHLYLIHGGVPRVKSPVVK